MPYDNWSQVKPLITKIIWHVKKKITAEVSLGKITFVFLGQHFKSVFFPYNVCPLLSSGPGALSLALEYKHVSYYTKKLNT